MIKYLYICVFICLAAGIAPAGWFQQSSGTTVILHSINFHHGNENLVWACGENGVILHTSNGGLNWVQQFSGTSNDLYAVVFMETTGGPVFAVGENGTILRTTNNGANWLSITSPVTKTLRDISDYNFVAVGDSGTILKSTNAGVNWSIVPSPVTQNLNSVCCIFANYIVGDNGTVLRGFSSGTNWQAAISGTTQNLRGIPLFGNADIATGPGGLILRSTNFGVNWVSQPNVSTAALNSSEFSVNNTSRIYVCGNSGTMLKTTNSGVNWGFQNSTTTNNLNSVFFYLDDNTGYAAGNNGTIIKTTDGGGPIVVALNNNNISIPDNFSLGQNYPNPFNPATTIAFDLPKASPVKLVIYNALGKEIETLVDQNLTAGSYETDYDATALPSGVYFYKLNTDGFTETKRMVLIK
jgi:photosystem II stability/assembly factor-like uncharacterized protein